METSSRLTHITFATKDLDESIAFYKKWFNLEVHLDRRPSGGGTVWMTTQDQNRRDRPEFVFVLHQGEVSKVHHFGFQVHYRESLDEIAEKAKAAGILVEGPTDSGIPEVGSYVFIEDPNGHIWEYTHGQPLMGL